MDSDPVAHYGHNRKERSIYLFELWQPLMIEPWAITCVALPYPGVKHSPIEGWEFVIGGTPKIFLTRALALLPDPLRLPADHPQI